MWSPCRKNPFIALLDFSLPLSELGDKLFNQFAGPVRAKLPIAVISATAPTIFKYIKKDLQRILKTVLEAQAPTASKEPWDKSLKARSLDIYCGKFHIKCYNFYQQYKDYFTTVGAKGANQMVLATSFF